MITYKLKYNPKTVKVPIEFDDFLKDLAGKFKKQTGTQISKTAIMRNIAKENRITIKRGKIDFRLF
jgi:hypothetical protein